MEQVGGPVPSLAAAQLALTRGRILAAARQMVVEYGLGVTIEQISKTAGVSPRTIFRHFSSHDQLIGEAITEIFREIWQPVPLPDPHDDLQGFLFDLMMASHRRNAQMLGRLFWDLMAPQAEQEPLMAEGRASRIASRRRFISVIAETAWHGAGGDGQPPTHVTEAFWLHISGFATFCYMADFGDSYERAAESSTSILSAVLRDAVEGRLPPADAPSDRGARVEPAATGESGYLPR